MKQTQTPSLKKENVCASKNFYILTADNQHYMVNRLPEKLFEKIPYHQSGRYRNIE